MRVKYYDAQGTPFANASQNATDAIAPSFPVFTYEAPNFKRGHAGLITVGDDAIFEIADEGEFGRALGYRGVKLENVSLDEYIWERYKRDGAQRTKRCMQVQINAYLYKHSTSFQRLYGDAYRKLIADSSFICIDDISANCDSCVHL